MYVYNNTEEKKSRNATSIIKSICNKYCANEKECSRVLPFLCTNQGHNRITCCQNETTESKAGKFYKKRKNPSN